MGELMENDVQEAVHSVGIQSCKNCSEITPAPSGSTEHLADSPEKNTVCTRLLV